MTLYQTRRDSRGVGIGAKKEPSTANRQQTRRDSFGAKRATKTASWMASFS
jgi:hypothetical protein